MSNEALAGAKRESIPRAVTTRASDLAALARSRAVGIPTWAVATLAFLAAFGVLFLRAPHTLLRAEFVIEDGIFYTDALARGPATLFEPYAGYLLVGHRALTLLQLLVDPYWAPLIGNATALAVLAAVPAYLVAAPLPGTRLLRLALAALFVLIPENRDIVGSLSHVQWSGAAWLALVPLAREPAGRTGRVIETAALVLAGLTGPFSVLFLPLYLFGPRRRLLALGLAGAAQIAAWMVGAPRRPSSELTAGSVPYVVALRGLVGPIIGNEQAHLFGPRSTIALGSALAAALAWALLHLPRGLAVRLLYVGVVPGVAGAVTYWYKDLLVTDLVVGTRYFWLAGIAMAWTIALTIRSTWTSIPLALLLVFGMTVSFHHEPPPFQDWATNSACIGGAAPCEVPVYPGGRFNVRWEPPVR